MRRILIYIILLLVSISCEKETFWKLDTNPKKVLVVDGIITNENKIQQVHITQTTESPNTKPEPILGAEVTISYDNFSVPLIENDSFPGYYFTKNQLQGEPGKTYQIRITYQGEIYSAIDRMYAPRPFSILKYSKSNSDKGYKIDWVANNFDQNYPAMYEIYLDWSSVPGFQDKNKDSCRAQLYYYTLPNIDISEIFAPSTENIIFPLGTTITERRHTISPEYAAFLRALLMETKWRGGLFDQIPANLPSNFNTGAIGFFGATSVNSTTIIAE